MSTTGRAVALLTGLALSVTCLVVVDALSGPVALTDSMASTTLRGPIAGRPVAAETATPDAGTARPPEQVWATRTLGRMTLEEKVGQLFVTFAYGATADAVDARNRTDFGVDTPAQVVSRYHLGGVIYFDWTSTLSSPVQIAELSNGLQRAAGGSGAGVPLLISTDQENGDVVRIGPPTTALPTAQALGTAGSADDARLSAEVSGRELRAMGVNQNLAPVADVDLNPANPVLGSRTFSADPAVTATMTGAQVAGYQEAVAATAKHFPGHGGTTTDSHVGLPVIDHDRAQWERLDAPPFRAAIAAGVDAVMVGHIVMPRLDPSGQPATLSPVLVDGLLRHDLGYDGVVMTDSLRMGGVRGAQPDERIPVLALQAGVDVLLMPANLDLAYRSVLAAVRSGELTERRIDASVRRVLELKWRRGAVVGPLGEGPLVNAAAVNAVVGCPAHQELARRLVGRR